MKKEPLKDRIQRLLSKGFDLLVATIVILALSLAFVMLVSAWTGVNFLHDYVHPLFEGLRG